MKINYNLKGNARKALATSLGEILNTAPTYKYAPTYAYELGEYAIDKDGILTGPDSQPILDALGERGHVAPETGLAFDLEEENTPPVEIMVPELQEQRNPDHDYNADFPISAAQEMNIDSILEELDADDLGIEVPLEGFTEAALTNLEKLIASKAGLIKKSLAADELDVVTTHTTLQFPWFTTTGTPEETEAYGRLVFALCDAAKNQKRVTAKEKPITRSRISIQ